MLTLIAVLELTLRLNVIIERGSSFLPAHLGQNSNGRQSAEANLNRHRKRLEIDRLPAVFRTLQRLTALLVPITSMHFDICRANPFPNEKTPPMRHL